MSVPCDSKAKSGLEALGASHDPINFDKEIEGHELDDACAPKGHEHNDACAPKGQERVDACAPKGLVCVCVCVCVNGKSPRWTLSREAK